LHIRLAIGLSRFNQNCLLHYFSQTPALGFTVRSALSDFNCVTDAGLVVLIVNAKLGSTLYVFIVFWMPDFEVDGNFDALVAAVAYYNTRQSLGFSILHIRFPVTYRSR
jgi:hypothetical protein